MNPRSYGIGVLGTGIMGRRMLAALLQHPRFHIVAAWDPDAAALQAALAPAAGAVAVAAAEACITHPDVELVYVASPPATHAAAVRAVLAAGRACLCEKPLTHDSADAMALCDAVRASGLPFAVNFPFARGSASRRLIGLVDGGDLGAVQSASIGLRFARWPRAWQEGAAGWLDGPAEGGFTREVLSHFVFLAERLFGPATVADVVLLRPAGRTETALRARLVHAGVSVQIDAAVAGEIADHNRFEVVGERGRAALTGWSQLEFGGITSERVDNTAATLDGLAALLDGRTDHGLATVAEAASVVRCIESLLSA